MTDIRYDPLDYEVDRDPHPTWKRMRDEAPLYRNDEHDFWALSRFDDVLAASIDHETYSSAHGTVLDMMTEEPHSSAMMIFMDPPDHTALRKLVGRAFSPRRIETLETDIRTLARGYLDRWVGTGGMDYVADFGALLPVMVIGSMLGVPEQDRDAVRHWTDELMHRDPDETDPTARLIRVQGELFKFFQAYIEERRARPADDMMTDLIQAEIVDDTGTERRLTDHEILAFVNLLSGAGNETVARLIGWTGSTLARFPEQRRKLVDDPSKIPSAVEELLRYEAPSPVQGRFVKRPVEWHGQSVPAGARMLLLTGSAGRDERRYEDPDRFDVERSFERHVTFGYGVHFCLGASLARMEGRIAIEETLARFPEWDVDLDAAEMVHTSTVRGWARLPIRFR